MQRDMMILVCHAADGHFADGDRKAVRRVLNRSEHIAAVKAPGPEHYEITCRDGGRLKLRTPGLEGRRSFHRIDLFLKSGSWTPHMLDLVFELMCAGGFGLVDNPETPQFFVTQPQQITYFPWLPEPPVLVRSSRDLRHSIGRPAL